MFMLWFLTIMMVGVLTPLVSLNPVFLVIWLVLLSMSVGLSMSLLVSTWMMYAVILLFTGGLMVLFTYMTTLVISSKTPLPNLTSVAMLVWVVFLLLMSSYPLILYQESTVSSLYLFSSIVILGFSGGYLLMILLTVVKFTMSNSGPLKSFFKNEI